jgi:uridine phosphorylase
MENASVCSSYNESLFIQGRDLKFANFSSECKNMVPVVRIVNKSSYNIYIGPITSHKGFYHQFSYLHSSLDDEHCASKNFLLMQFLMKPKYH